jgi:hypothetical protein
VAGPTGYRLLSGIDGSSVQDLDTGCEKLAHQIARTINWAACLESCRAVGAEKAIELGPGTALSRMAARIFSAGRARSTEEFRTLAGLRDWLSELGWTKEPNPDGKINYGSRADLERKLGQKVEYPWEKQDTAPRN